MTSSNNPSVLSKVVLLDVVITAVGVLALGLGFDPALAYVDLNPYVSSTATQTFLAPLEV